MKSNRDALYELYMKAFINTLENCKSEIEVSTSNIKKLTFYGVKAINCKPKERTKEIKTYFEFIETIKNVMSLLTPLEFVNVFPISKEYNGKKDECKDYFYTMEYINKLNVNKPIGEGILDFLWEYHSLQIRVFVSNYFSAISDMRRVNGQKGLMEEFLDEHNIPTYSSFENKGKKYLMNSHTGEIVKERKLRPRHLKIVK